MSKSEGKFPAAPKCSPVNLPVKHGTHLGSFVDISNNFDLFHGFDGISYS